MPVKGSASDADLASVAAWVDCIRNHRRPVANEDVGWPMDLNQPKDRESVDKAVSFHDV